MKIKFYQMVSIIVFNIALIYYRDDNIFIFRSKAIIFICSDKTRFVRDPRLIPRGSWIYHLPLYLAFSRVS